MSRRLPLSFSLFLLIFCGLSAQNTVGLLDYNINETYPGYTLIYPHNQPTVYLLDGCGEIAHSWPDSAQFRPGNTAYMLEDGRLVKTKRLASIADDPIWAGGGGGFIEIRSWENELLWEFELNNADARLHHDIKVLPNGNILALAWEHKTREEAIAVGRDTALIIDDELWPDYLFEINPETDEIVWEWHTWDHLIQDYDETKPNFGVVADHPERVDINYAEFNAGAADWMHSNYIDYNAELDQIMICIPYFSEMWVIDHSTTTEEAAGSTGGNQNKGGDLLYRFGNAEVYDQGDEMDQLLFFPHNCHWTDLPIQHPFWGSVVCFNNRVGEDFSTAEIFYTSWEMYNSQYEIFDGKFPPFSLNNTIEHPESPQAMYSTGLSSIDLLPNGNILLCSGRQGYVFELNADEEIVWEYITPLLMGQPVDQGTVLTLNQNLTFEALRYPVDYAAFAGRDLSSKGWIETEPNTDFCDQITPVVQVNAMNVHVYPTITSGRLQLEWENGREVHVQIYDIHGRLRMDMYGLGGRKYMDMSTLENGLYLVLIDNETVVKVVKQ